MNKPRIMIADDHTVVAEAFRNLLEPQYEVIAVVNDGRSPARNWNGKKTGCSGCGYRDAAAQRALGPHHLHQVNDWRSVLITVHNAADHSYSGMMTLTD